MIKEKEFEYELEPCPFCGSPHIYAEELPCFECATCGIRQRLYNTLEEAVEAWNKRAKVKQESPQ
jgi:hypothetical protein